MEFISIVLGINLCLRRRNKVGCSRLALWNDPRDVRVARKMSIVEWICLIWVRN